MTTRPRPKDSPEVQFSKTLSYILRHGAAKEGIPIRSDGNVLVTDLIKYKKFRGKKLEDFQLAVASNDKQRYAMTNENGVWLIRANQGHSIKVAVELEEIKDPAELPIVVHGTYHRAWSTIERDGLKKMNRNHVHFAVGKPGESGVISGMRSSSQVLIYINVPLAMSEGIKFYRSANNVILSEGINGVIHPKYFAEIEVKQPVQ
ncbi:UNVERIFIED_CONTAM: tRNA 2'-phosphotransferase 1 [Siphonaria sp. JEL0065]|nr:tRNA 2'-phosphotransferase 1 [Siphonaria sp. JEL0065]